MSASDVTLPAPAAQDLLGLPAPAFHLAMLVLAAAAFGFILWKRARLLLQGAPDPRLDRIGTRLARLLFLGFGQARQPRYPAAGVLHILIFAGFLILSLRSLTLLGEGFSAGFALPGLAGRAGAAYASLKDWTALVVLACCVVAAVRRALFAPARYHDRHARKSHAREAYVILGLISLLMVADALYEGAALAGSGGAGPRLPLASAAALCLGGLPDAALGVLHLSAFWIHNAALLFFLCYLPVSKHFHVITSLPNVFLLDLRAGGAVKPPRHGAVDQGAAEALGVGRLEGFTWKHLLDFYTCTDCGRCSDQCPAYATGTLLSPRMISIKCRDLAYQCFPLLGATVPPEERPALVGDVIAAGEIWSCTTCGACEEVCPVLIEYVDKIVDLRRFLVDQGDVPPSLQKPLAALEKHGNPYGKMARKRGDWAGGGEEGGSGVRVLKEGESADLLFFTDSCVAYDPRLQRIGQALGALFGAAGLDCGTLGKDEVDSGHEARRMGEEGLFETLRDKNLEALGRRTFARLVTADPHAMSALKNDGYGLAQPILHHSQLLAELLAAGRLVPGPLGDERVYTFHDPCYLGRHNGEFAAPRAVLSALPGLRLVEMARARSRSFCCGGGSLYLFSEVECEARMGELRLCMAEEAGAQVIVTACPFCLLNLEDAIKTSGREGRMEVLDLAELVVRSLNRGVVG
ncbi:MAG: (Fe-S)-binding protein [Planctomycetes bacterium]|nr:(Fe-S)-binding protein [Planctomycetota bacterium]